jgi:hypothetical protein
MAKNILLEKIISGGQTGIDIAALHAVHAYNQKNKPDIVLQTGGYCPHNYMTSNGRNDELATFNLIPVNDGVLAAQYILRSQLNVQAADATLAFRFKKSVGTDKTIAYATTGKWISLKNATLENGKAMKSAYKPTFVITQIADNTWSLIDNLKDFLIRYKVRSLNICGHRDECYEREVKDFLEIAFASFFQKTNK